MNGEKNGMWIFYNEREVKIREQNFTNGAANGKFVEYYPNGKKQMEGSYDNRVREGKWTYWDAKGKVMYSVQFEHGNKVKVYKELSGEYAKPF